MTDFSITGTRKLRILLSGLSSNYGGKETFVLSLFHALKPIAECTFITSKSNVAHRKEIENSGGAIVQVRGRGDHPIGYLQDIHRLIRTGDFDAIWLNQTTISSVEPLFFGKLAKVPNLILHSHSSSNMGTELTRILHVLQRPFVRWLSNNRLACSDEAAHWFFPHSSWRFVPNAFDTKSFTFSSEARKRVRDSLSLDQNTIAVIHVARLGPAKNHAFDVEIASALSRKGVDFRLLLVGDGPYRSDVEALIHQHGLIEQVDFLGIREDVPALLSASDVAILPSTFEGLPFTALEAQASGLPILVSDAVSDRCRVSDLVRRLPLTNGPEFWADEVSRVVKQRGERDRNPLRGTVFDIDVAAELYRELVCYNESK